MGVGGQRHIPVAFIPGNDTVTVLDEAGWVPGQVWAVAKSLAATGIRSRKPSCSELLYRLRYLGPFACFLYGGRKFAQ